jgi:FdrA protein
VVAVRAVDESAVAAAVATAQRALSGPPPASGGGLFTPPPARTAAAAGRAAGAGLALISVPGPHAFVEAIDAVRAGMHVMVFSDNVPVADEVALKEEAARRDLLVMGPDCGTAIVAGVGLGFANVVDPGPVGLTGASGTGLQQMCCLLDAAGVGVRHALGTGSRDLSAEVGGRSTLRALAALDADPGIEVIVVVSKPPDPTVAARVAAAVAACTTPVVTALLGEPGVTLEGAARETIAALGRDAPEPPSWLPHRTTGARPGVLRGLFSGGTLRDEARAIAVPVVGPVAVDASAGGHRMVDYGDDEYTRGRAHPMIDPSLRLDALAAAVADPVTAVVLLDVVLGHAAHPDPAAELVPLVEGAVAAGIPVVVSLCGSRLDPQGRDRQAETLAGAGAEVYLSNAAAARRAAALVAGGTP